MTDQSIKDYDALAASPTKRIRVGGREFTISHIPAIVTMMFTRQTYGLLKGEDGEDPPDIVSVKLDALVATLNVNLAEPDRINEEWVMANIPSEIYDDLVDDLLGPLYEVRERAEKRRQEKMVDLLTPAIRAAVKEEITAQQKQPQRTLKNR